MRAFVDTGALLALAHASDQYHARAVATAARHHKAGGRYLSSVLVLSEFYSHMLHLRGPAVAREILSRLLADPAHQWHDVTQPMIADARANWLSRFRDQRLTLVDAVSFEIMRREKVAKAFAFDAHFRVAGFTLLD